MTEILVQPAGFTNNNQMRSSENLSDSVHGNKPTMFTGTF